MEQDVMTFAQVMAIIVTSVAILIGIGLGTRVLWNLGSRPKRMTDPGVDERLKRLEGAVDVIALEVERISEAQRFTVGLLSERLPPPLADRVSDLSSAASPKRTHTTPH